MKKLLFLGACLVALASQPVMAQTREPQVIVVRLYYTGVSTGHIAITRGEGKTEDIEFKQTRTNQPNEAETCQREFEKLYQAGYSLKSTFSPGTGAVSTLVFVKGQ